MPIRRPPLSTRALDIPNPQHLVPIPTLDAHPFLAVEAVLQEYITDAFRAALHLDGHLILPCRLPRSTACRIMNGARSVARRSSSRLAEPAPRRRSRASVNATSNAATSRRILSNARIGARCRQTPMNVLPHTGNSLFDGCQLTQQRGLRGLARPSLDHHCSHACLAVS